MNKKPFYLSLILFFSLFTAPVVKAFESVQILICGSLITGLCAGKLIWNRYYKNQLKTLKQKNNQKLSFATHEVQGNRPTMEDAHDAQITDQHAYFGLFDGHGSQKLAQYAADNLYGLLTKNKLFATNTKQALHEAFVNIHHNFKTKNGKAHYGSCASAILIKDDNIWSANAGDSRAVLCNNGKAKRLSYDHKPCLEEETKRITKNGGFVTYGHKILAYKLPPIIFAANSQTGIFQSERYAANTPSRVCGRIAISRALGDYEFENLIIPDPYVSKHQCTGDEQFIILACDGLWDIMHDQAAVDIVKHQLLKYKNSKKTNEEISKEICKYLCQIASGNIDRSVNSHDNVTVTLILFPGVIDPTPQNPKTIMEKPLAFATHELQGRRHTMDDAHFPKTQEDSALIALDSFMYGVFDGHGGSRKAATFCADHLPTILANNPLFNEDPALALQQSYVDLNELYRKENPHDGAAAVTVLLKNNKIYSANAGDARAVLCINNKAKRLSHDHKPDEEEERIRIEKHGEHIDSNTIEQFIFLEAFNPLTGEAQTKKINRIIPKIKRGGYPLSRAIGDFHLAPALIPDPYVSVHECTGEEQFLIIACDGLWDVVEDQAAVDLIRFKLNEYQNTPEKARPSLNELSEQISEFLVDTAYGMLESGDNITVSIVLLPKIRQVIK